MKIIKILGIIISAYWVFASIKAKYEGKTLEAIYDMCWLILVEVAILM